MHTSVILTSTAGVRLQAQPLSHPSSLWCSTHPAFHQLALPLAYSIPETTAYAPAARIAPQPKSDPSACVPAEARQGDDHPLPKQQNLNCWL